MEIDFTEEELKELDTIINTVLVPQNIDNKILVSITNKIKETLNKE